MRLRQRQSPLRWETVSGYDALSERAAERVLGAIIHQPRLVLGLPTGRTPEGMYAHLVQHCVGQERCFDGVKTFNLDEYVGLKPDHPGSYARYMQQRLFDHVGLFEGDIFIPDGLAEDVLADEPDLPMHQALERECERYERAIADAGGLDLTVLGLGRNGHIAFNEPGSPFDSRTRVVRLDDETRRANAQYFGNGDVPEWAITMGLATILASKSIVLLASGASKAEAVARLRHGPVAESFPASLLHLHDDVTVLVDREAARLL